MAEVPLKDHQAGPSRRIGVYILLILAGLLILAVVAAIGFWQSVSSPYSSDTATQLFTIEQGDSVHIISKNLHGAELIRSTWNFEEYVYVDGSEANFIAGVFELNPTMSIRDIVTALTKGDVSNESSITIIEGWTIENIDEYLAKEDVLGAGEFARASDVTNTATLLPNSTFSFLVDKPDEANLEGFLFPDTYRIFSNSTAEDIIQRMLDNFGDKLSNSIVEGFRDQGLSIFEGVTLASIVEKEVRTVDDRKIAAGVFLTRIENSIALQSDATVNYVTGKSALQPSAEDVETDNPYNTYKYPGLPPGPISNPSFDALEAVANPTETDYLYFLTKPDGSTVFSETYDEHLANKRKYLQ